jgi:excisionase family DNA binding protein
MHRASDARPGSSRPAVAQMSNASERWQVLTLTQTAAYLRISKAHLSNVIAGRFPGVPVLRHVRVGRRVLIKREWADQWLEAAAEGSPHQW